MQSFPIGRGSGLTSRILIVKCPSARSVPTGRYGRKREKLKGATTFSGNIRNKIKRAEQRAYDAPTRGVI